MALIHNLISIILFALILFIGFRGNFIRQGSEKGPFSYSKTQILFWSSVVIPAFYLHWICNFDSSQSIDLNEVSLILIGQSSLTTYLSQSVPSFIKEKVNSKSDQVSKGFWSDIVMGSDGLPSLNRFQGVIFNVIFLVIYIVEFHGNNYTYPEFSNLALGLIGLSNASHIVSKYRELNN